MKNFTIKNVELSINTNKKFDFYGDLKVPAKIASALDYLSGSDHLGIPRGEDYFDVLEFVLADESGAKAYRTYID